MSREDTWRSYLRHKGRKSSSTSTRKPQRSKIESETRLKEQHALYLFLVRNTVA